MKRLLKLPRKRRDLIGGVTGLIGFIVSFLLLGPNIAPVGMLPFAIFFAWLCPETWDGK